MSYFIESLDDDELAAQEVAEASEQAEKTGDYDQVKQITDKIIDEKGAADMEDVSAAEPPVDDPAVSDEDGSNDAPEEAPVTEPDAEVSEEEVDPDAAEADSVSKVGDKVSGIATESLRAESYSRLTLESFYHVDVVGGIRSGVGLLKDLAVVLFELGVKYTPSVVSMTKRSLIYLFIRSVKSVLTVTLFLRKRIKGHFSSFDRHMKKIQKVRKRLNEKTLKGPLHLKAYKPETDRYGSWFTVGDKVSPMGSAKAIDGFMGEMVAAIDNSIQTDINSVKKLIDLTARNLSGVEIGLLSISAPTKNFSKRQLLGLEVDSSILDTYVYQHPLPNQLRFVGQYPKPGLSNIDDISKAFRGSGLFLSPININPPREIQVDYMDEKQLQVFLDTLEAICRNGVSHVGFYQRIEKLSNGLKMNYRHYYQRLTQGEEAADALDELAEYIYLKQSFVNRVYVPAASDVHDYVSTFLSRAINFASENVRKLEAD